MNDHIIIVGSGVAAVAICRQLLRQQPHTQITLFEAGGHLPMADQRRWLDMVMTGKSPTLAFEDDSQDGDISGTGGMLIKGGRMLARGGSTNHWGGWCPRMKPEDFRLGEVRSESINWPFSYDDLAPYYTQAEHFLHVCGDASHDQPPRHGGNFPHEPVPYSAFDQLLIPTLKQQGISYEHLPIARKGNQCQTTGTCDYCPFDAKYTGESDLASLLIEYPEHITLHILRPVTRIVFHNKAQVKGVEYLDIAQQATGFLAADKVIVAAGTLESTKLLQVSSTPDWPNGAGNHNGHLGRHLVTHPMVRSLATIKNNTDLIGEELDFPTLAIREYDNEQFQSQGKMYVVRQNIYSRIAFEHRILTGKSTDEILTEVKDHSLIELRGIIEAFPHRENRLEPAAGATRLGLPRTRIVYSESAETQSARLQHSQRLQQLLTAAGFAGAHDRTYAGNRIDHASGTCRMSADDNLGVVDSNLQVHGTDNLYVCSNAVLPNTGAVNPTLTLASLALRLGDHLAQL